MNNEKNKADAEDVKTLTGKTEAFLNGILTGYFAGVVSTIIIIAITKHLL